jgi:phosphomethylpyrimidine synthase
MTQLREAKKGKITPEAKIVAQKEGLSEKLLLKEIAAGHTIIPANILHKNLKPIGIGKSLLVKTNANLGTSNKDASLEKEMQKLELALKHGADTVMDLSTGGNIGEIRSKLLKKSPVPFGTVCTYQALVKRGNILDLQEKDFLDAFENHVKDGVDFVTVHAGLTKDCIPLLKNRLAGVVSRGGAILVQWMKHNNAENPYFENFDRIIEISQEYDCTLSLGDGLRPGAIADATDKPQLEELKNLGMLQKKAVEKDVQVMIEGPGHVPLNEIKRNVELQKKYCNGAPFYVLGPLVTDVAPGYDHITCAIGGTLAGYYGADFLCYVTPAEHLGLPDADDVKEGIIAARIAAHAADVARGNKKAIAWDFEMSSARKKLDWEKMIGLSVNPEKARAYRKRSGAEKDECTMCGDFCVYKVNKE